MKTLTIYDKSIFWWQNLLIDDEDFEKVSKVSKSIRKDSGGRKSLRIYTNGSSISLTNFILNLDKSVLIDHKDRNQFNNQKSNLRICNSQQNNFNKGPITGQYKGVSYNKENSKWKAQIMKTHKNYHIGYFNTEIEAAKAYDKKAKKLFGEFAYLNFPETNNSQKHETLIKKEQN